MCACDMVWHVVQIFFPQEYQSNGYHNIDHRFQQTHKHTYPLAHKLTRTHTRTQTHVFKQISISNSLKKFILIRIEMICIWCTLQSIHVFWCIHMTAVLPSFDHAQQNIGSFGQKHWIDLVGIFQTNDLIIGSHYVQRIVFDVHDLARHWINMSIGWYYHVILCVLCIEQEFLSSDFNIDRGVIVCIESRTRWFLDWK